MDQPFCKHLQHVWRLQQFTDWNEHTDEKRKRGLTGPKTQMWLNMKTNTNKWISHLVITSSMSDFYSSLLTGTQLPSSEPSNLSFSCNDYINPASFMTMFQILFPAVNFSKNVFSLWFTSTILIHRLRFLPPIKFQTGDSFSRESHSRHFQAVSKLH